MSQPKHTTNPQAPLNGKPLLSWIIILILSGCCIYLWVSKNSIEAGNKAALDRKQQVIDSVIADRIFLQTEFDAASVKIDQLMSKGMRQEDTLLSARTAISGLRAQIKTILDDKNAAQADLLKARTMLYLLIGKAQEYEGYIAELEKDNQTLTGENKLLSEERDNTVERNIALKMAGSVLHASEIRVAFIHDRNGREKATGKAKRTDELRIAFNIDENRIAESGLKQLYICIIGPDNKVLYSVPDGSGTTYSIKGGSITYSLGKEIYFKRNRPIKNIEVSWTQDKPYASGKYKAEIYSAGYKIGEGSGNLK